MGGNFPRVGTCAGDLPVCSQMYSLVFPGKAKCISQPLWPTCFWAELVEGSGEFRGRGGEKPGYFLLSLPALWGSPSHVGPLWCQLLPDSPPLLGRPTGQTYCVRVWTLQGTRLHSSCFHLLSSFLHFSSVMSPLSFSVLEVMVAPCCCSSLGCIIIPLSAFQLFQYLSH